MSRELRSTNEKKNRNPRSVIFNAKDAETNIGRVSKRNIQ